MAFSLMSCDDDETITRYKVVNTDDFGEVPIYASSDNETIIGYVSSRTDCELVSDGTYGDGHRTKMAFFDGKAGYVPDRYVFKKEYEGKMEDQIFLCIDPYAKNGDFVNIYSSPNKKKKHLLQTITNQTLIDSIMSYDNNMYHIRLRSGEEAYIESDYISRTTRRVWVPEPDALDKYIGHNKWIDSFISFVREQQDTDLHYSINMRWLYVKLAIWGLVFCITAFIAFSQFADSKKVPWWGIILLSVAGIALLYYEWQYSIVMGDGYEIAYESDWGNTQSLGLFLNLIILIIGGILFFAVAISVLFVIIILQQLIVPVLSVAYTGISDGSTIGNIIIFVAIYVGVILGFLIGPASYNYLIVIVSVLVVCGLIISLISGYKTGNYFSILILLAPILYVISIATTYFIAKAIIYCAAILGTIFLFILALGQGSKFQSQDDGSVTVVKNQAGQTIGYEDKDGWHNT